MPSHPWQIEHPYFAYTNLDCSLTVICHPTSDRDSLPDLGMAMGSSVERGRFRMHLWQEQIEMELQPDPNRHQDSNSRPLAPSMAGVLIGHPVEGRDLPPLLIIRQLLIGSAISVSASRKFSSVLRAEGLSS